MKSGRNLRFYISSLVMGLVLVLELSACGSGGLNGSVTTPGGFTPLFNVPASSTTTTASSTTTTYTIGGTISSVSNGSIASMVLADTVNGVSDAYNTTSGVYSTIANFTFSSAVASGASYTVSIASQPVTGTCTITNATGTATSNVSNVAVQCP